MEDYVLSPRSPSEPSMLSQKSRVTFSTTDRWLVGLASLGALFMTYLTYLHYKTAPSSFCNFGAGFSCDLVNKSTFSEILGIPVSFLGLVFFVGVIALTWKKFFADYLGVIQLATAASLAFSLYLTYVEIFLLGSICVFCEASKVIMVAILLLAANGRKTHIGARI